MINPSFLVGELRAASGLSMRGFHPPQTLPKHPSLFIFLRTGDRTFVPPSRDRWFTSISRTFGLVDGPDVTDLFLS